MVAPYYEPVIDKDTGEQVTICGFPCVFVGYHFHFQAIKAYEERKVQAMMQRLKPRQEL